MSRQTGILAEIVRRKRWERDILRDALRGQPRIDPASPWLPEPELLERAGRFLKAGGCERQRRSLVAALQDPKRLTVIAEIKRSSPSAGRFAQWQDPTQLAEAYAASGAQALSVLTDTHFFDGSPRFLGQCRAVFPGPVLRKDFLADEADLAISAALGADAVLLIVRLLGAQTAGMLRAARCYDLEVLVEVHNQRELDLAMACGASLMGINNRDLDDFSVDLERSEQLMTQIPSPIGVVSESGIGTPEDAVRMRRAGADAILVGQALAERDGEGLADLQIEQKRGHRR
ncbi:MAG: indole-3-glycerol-phosphate synthase [Rickettsiales bacterium]|nr:indole-3-glycerol-phosphate synthase [Rickettsiales bacterium]